MEYRNLGSTGLKVSVLGYGNFEHTPEQQERNTQLIKTAYEAGINFFDTAEFYSHGESEKSLGLAIKELKINRNELVITTKIFNGEREGTKIKANAMGTSRKRLLEGLERSLKNLQLDYVDVVYCHRYDESTPTEEVVVAMGDLIRNGKALYWGTSQWPAARIMQAIYIAEKLGLPKPVTEQCEYNLITRKKMEDEYLPLFDDFKYGTTIYSPLAMGILTGKYNNGVPAESRMGRIPELRKIILEDYYGFGNKEDVWVNKLKQFEELAKELGTTMPRLAIAWVVKYENISTCILGANKLSQLEDNLKSLEVVKKITPEIAEKLEQIFQSRPVLGVDFNDWQEYRNRR